MSDEEDRHTLSIQLANQIINTANNRLQEGMDVIDKIVSAPAGNSGPYRNVPKKDIVVLSAVRKSEAR